MLNALCVVAFMVLVSSGCIGASSRALVESRVVMSSTRGDPDSYGPGLHQQIQVTWSRMEAEADRLGTIARVRAREGRTPTDGVLVRIRGNRVVIYRNEARTLYALQEELSALLRSSGDAWCVSGSEHVRFGSFPEAGDIMDPVYGVRCWVKVPGGGSVPLYSVITACGSDEAIHRRYHRHEGSASRAE